MQTYTTIKQAFANGTGDVFFTSNDQFIAVSRKADHSGLIASGFTFLSYADTLRIAAEQDPKSPEPDPVPAPVKSAEVKSQKNSLPAGSYYYSEPFYKATCDSFYDEFPDAYNQNL